MSTVSDTTTITPATPDAPAEASSVPTIELLGQPDAGGCCGGGSCGI
ncbi:hypothetical protein [Cryobacterium cryoconiti]|nr:hypothetical protein [Cryobacterium cryoconiti]